MLRLKKRKKKFSFKEEIPGETGEIWLRFGPAHSAAAGPPPAHPSATAVLPASSGQSARFPWSHREIPQTTRKTGARTFPWAAPA